MFCSNCGKEIKKTYNFCPKCGKKIESDTDLLFEKVKKFVIENQKVSVSLIEKEFKISKIKANDIINELEENGIIGPLVGRKRKVLIDKINKEEIKEDFGDKVKNNVEKLMSTTDNTQEFEEKDIEDNMFLAMLSYIGIFSLVPYFIKTDSKFVKYHAVRGLNLLIIESIYTLLDNILGMVKVSKVIINYGNLVATKMITPLWISIPMAIIGLVLVSLSITGIVNVCKGKAKELPLISKIKIVK